MAITITPPIPLNPDEQNDITILSNLLVLISTILDNESAITGTNAMTTGAIASLNTTLIDASDRIDATINPPLLLS